jgi:hypothetical protein
MSGINNGNMLPVKSSAENAIHPWASSSRAQGYTKDGRVSLSCQVHQQVSQTIDSFPDFY